MSTRDLFLCHADADKEEYVRPLALELRKCSVSYWLDEAEIAIGESITRKIGEGLTRSRFVVVFITEGFLTRSWPQFELQSALSKEASSGETKVLPIVSIPHEQFIERFPLLRDKLYLRWTGDLRKMAESLVGAIGDSFEERCTHFYPVEHQGPVWIRFLQHSDNVGIEHRYILRWGTWRCEGTFTSHDPAVCLNTTKGPDSFAVPVFIEVSPACNVASGVGRGPCNTIIDANFDWRQV